MNDNFPFNHFINFDNSNKNKELNSFFPEKDDNFQNINLDNNFNNTQDDSQEEYDLDELKSVTDELKKAIKSNVSPQKYSAFFESTFAVQAVNANSIEVAVTTPFIKNMIQSHFQSMLKQAVMDLFGRSYEININVLTGINKDKSPKSLESSAPPVKEEQYADIKNNSVKNTTFRINSFTPSKEDLMDEVNSRFLNHMNKGFGQKIDPNKTFDNYVVGPSNNMAQALALSVADSPGKVYPQLYLYGNSGLGKTHLLHAICNSIAMKKPNLRICITTANSFMSEMIMAIQGKADSEFRRKYTECVDVLIIDDIHELKDKPRTQTEFFHIFNELQSKGKQLIFTSDKPPKEIGGIEERIKTRLSSALLIEIHQPDLETRIAILKKKAIERDIFLDDDVVNFIASCIKSNIRELEGSLIKLGAYSDLMKVDIDLEIAKEQLGLTGEFEQKTITIDIIASNVANYFRIPIGDLRGKSRLKDITFARHIAMFMSHKIIRTTLEEIGDYYGKRDHTSVIHGIKKIERLIKEDSSLSQKIYEIESSL